MNYTAYFKNTLDCFRRRVYNSLRGDNMNKLEKDLEDIITQRWIGEWCIPFVCTWDSLRQCSAGQLRNIFFPKSVLQEPYIHYVENKWAKDAFEFNSDILSEEEDDLISVYSLTFDQEAFAAKSFFRIKFKDDIYLSTRTSRLNSSRLRQEFFKLNRVYFVRKDSVGLFLKKSCPLLFSCLTECRLHNKL